jgi:hypothetical protein
MLLVFAFGRGFERAGLHDPPLFELDALAPCKLAAGISGSILHCFHRITAVSDYLSLIMRLSVSNTATLLPALACPVGGAKGRGGAKEKARAAQNAFRAGHCEREAPLGAG